VVGLSILKYQFKPKLYKLCKLTSYEIILDIDVYILLNP